MSIAAKINLILCAVMLLLVTLIWRLQQPQAEHPLLRSFNPSTIDHITVTHPDKPQLTLQKIAGRWVLPARKQFPANATVIEQILAIGSAEILSQYPLPTTLSAFGLDPGIAITLNQQTLMLGKLNPLNNQRYVQVEDQLYLIFDRYSHHLKSSLLSTKLIPENGRIQSIQTPNLHLTRNGAVWSAQPDTPPQTVQNIVNLWSNATAKPVVLNTKPPKPANIRIQLENQPLPIVFWFDHTTGRLLRHHPAVQYQLSDALVKQLLLAPE